MNTVVILFDMLISHRNILSVGLSVNNAFNKCFFFLEFSLFFYGNRRPFNLRRRHLFYWTRYFRTNMNEDEWDEFILTVYFQEKKF